MSTKKLPKPSLKALQEIVDEDSKTHKLKESIYNAISKIKVIRGGKEYVYNNNEEYRKAAMRNKN